MNGFQFANPQWSGLIWLVVAFTAAMIWFDRRGVSALDGLLSPLMQRRLVRRPARWRRLAQAFLMGIAAVGLVAALMRPQWGFRRLETERVGAEIMICLDVSRSMLASDVAPNRLGRAKAEIRDLLGFLGDDHVGLIAFAGKATVLCPLTPDFGFLRMVLETTGPGSVAMGGTNLESPLRKAVAGFRGATGLSRAIILITDGEDHDSFVMDAAREAAQRGVRVIAIGFGDENGSALYVTDPQTGAHSRVVDHDGKPVVTRLDGDLLRKIAMETEGVYVPAGTGVLDLKSIYDTHLVPLTRGQLASRERLVKQEGFQWMLLGSLLSVLAASLVVSGPPTIPAVAGGLLRARGRSAVAAALLMAAVASAAFAQTSQPAAGPDTGSDTGSVSGQDGSDPLPVAPRQSFNDALGLLEAGQLDEAEAGFELARSRAGADGLLRYRAVYNLGSVAVRRGDALIKEQPREALEHLHTAARWFRRAVELQPGEVDPRHNLQVVTRRALVLADSLASRNDRPLAERIDELIDQQRALAVELGKTVQHDKPNNSDALRSRFASLEVQQRQVMSSLDELVEATVQEAQQLEAVQEDQRSADQRLRLAQLRAAEAYLHTAVGRMGQARRQIRQRQAQRAYRRAAHGLDQLTRARDQLRDLVDLLTAVIGDARVLVRLTATLAHGSDPGGGSAGVGAPPSWLTRQYLVESVTTVHQRAGEVAGRIEAGLSDQNEPQEAADRNPRLVALLHEAAPPVRRGVDLLAAAIDSLNAQRDWESYRSQAQAVVSLIEARELFLDIRRLVELIYTDQVRVGSMVGHLLEQDPSDAFLPPLVKTQAANIDRVERLGGMIRDQLEAAAADKVDADTPNPSPSKQDSPQPSSLELAEKRLPAVADSFRQIAETLKSFDAIKNDPDRAEAMKNQVDRGVVQAEALRRLFLSIVEHLREALKKQVQLSDETRDTATLVNDKDARQKQIGPLGARQRDLGDFSQQIAQALLEQSQQDPRPVGSEATGAPGPQPPDDRASQEAAGRLAEAADHVDKAADAMGAAGDELVGEPVDFSVAGDHQDRAAEDLAAALALLSPPQDQDNQQQDQDEQSDQGQGQQDDGRQQNQPDGSKGQAGDDKKDRDQAASQHNDAQRLLQAVRDRQAQRQRDREKKRSIPYAPVEKDW